MPRYRIKTYHYQGHACTHHATHSVAPTPQRGIHFSFMRAGGQQHPQAIGGSAGTAPPAALAPALAPAAVAPGAAPTPASAPAATPALHSVFASGSTRPRRGSEASKLKFPIDVPDVVKSAIANFVPSDGQFLAKVNHRNPSSIHH